MIIVILIWSQYDHRVLSFVLLTINIKKGLRNHIFHFMDFESLNVSELLAIYRCVSSTGLKYRRRDSRRFWLLRLIDVKAVYVIRFAVKHRNGGLLRLKLWLVGQAPFVLEDYNPVFILSFYFLTGDIRSIPKKIKKNKLVITLDLRHCDVSNCHRYVWLLL